jgi:membrane protein implicated in regulation of membrane protease activity
MALATIWWILCGLAVAAELVTGTFYLLMLALGLAAAALAANFGATLVWQTLLAAVVGGGAVTAWHLLRGRRANGPPANANRDVNLDIGETVFVEAWLPDGTGSVHYRGARWTVVHRPGATLSTGPHRVAEVIGNRLMVDPI